MSPPAPNASAFNKALADHLAARRRDLSISQGALAAELGTDQGAVSRVESGARNLTVGEAFLWLCTLGHSADSAAALLAALWRQHTPERQSLWVQPE